MSTLGWVFAALCGVFLLLSAIGFSLWGRDRRRLRRLTEQAQQFLMTGEHLHYSTDDDAFAPLQNALCDLEDRVLLEQSHMAEALRRNAALISDISHQLKTPLAGIRLYCEMAESGETIYRQKQLRLVEKMERLISGLLRLEKLRSDAYVMHFAPHDMANLLREVVRELYPLFPEKRICVTGSCMLRCDGAWLSEAVGNLVKNACEHTAPDGQVMVRCEKSERAVLLQIEDDGGGVEAKELPLLFYRFHRTENASPDSAGLGMAIAKAIVEKHHGTIGAENGERGLRVTICLPVLEGTEKI